MTKDRTLVNSEAQSGRMLVGNRESITRSDRAELHTLIKKINFIVGARSGM